MTLCTHVFVKDQVEPTEVFKVCRDLLGATEKTEAQFYFQADGEWSIGNKIAQGLPALLDIEFRPGEALRTLDDAMEHEDFCDEDCDGKWHSPACWLAVSFDTAYGYKTADGEGCGHLHVRYVSELGLWLDARGIAWEWTNEFTGERHTGYDRLPDLVGGGEAATEWFQNLVLPAIEASARA